MYTFKFIIGIISGFLFFFSYLSYVADSSSVSGFLVFALFVLSVYFIVDSIRKYKHNSLFSKTKSNETEHISMYPQFNRTTPNSEHNNLTNINPATQYNLYSPSRSLSGDSIYIVRDGKLHRYPASTNMLTEYVLSNDELIFIDALHRTFDEMGLSGNDLVLQRLASGFFNINYHGIAYLGKFKAEDAYEKFKVIKQGAKRATKVFNTKTEAQSFIIGKEGYEILNVKHPKNFHMQFVYMYDICEINPSSIDECNSLIYRYVEIAKKAKRDYMKATKF